MIRTARVGLMGVIAVLLVAGEAGAQLSMAPLGGAATMHLGSTTGGDVSGGTFTLGGSIAVVEKDGWGAEFDYGYANGDDDGRLDRANLQTFMLNLHYIWPRGRLRPFFSAGAGGMRARGCVVGCPQEVDWTDWAASGGAGAFYRFNDIVGARGDVRYFRSLQDHPDPSRPESFDFWRISGGISVFWNVVP